MHGAGRVNQRILQFDHEVNLSAMDAEKFRSATEAFLYFFSNVFMHAKKRK